MSLCSMNLVWQLLGTYVLSYLSFAIVSTYVITSHAINHAVIQLYSGQVGYVAIDLVNVPMLLGTW